MEKRRSMKASYESSILFAFCVSSALNRIWPSCNSVTSWAWEKEVNLTLMNWSSWMDPDRSISEEKNTVWKVLGERWILWLRSSAHTYPIWFSASCSSWKSIAPLLSVSKKSKAFYTSASKQTPTFHFHTSSRRDLNSSTPSWPLYVSNLDRPYFLSRSCFARRILTVWRENWIPPEDSAACNSWQSRKPLWINWFYLLSLLFIDIYHLEQGVRIVGYACLTCLGGSRI